MASHFLKIFGVSLLVFASYVNGVYEDDVSFDQNYFSLWGSNHLTRVNNNKEVQLLLDQYSGGTCNYHYYRFQLAERFFQHLHSAFECYVDLHSTFIRGGFRSISDYGSGRFGMRMKLPYANLTGIIISFYLTSAPDSYNPGNHDEIDFEFIAGTDLQTNIYAGDSGNRGERYRLPFDPRENFHIYEILWNPNIVVFYVDKVPVRVFKNNKDRGVNYFSNPMHTEASIWTADWAGAVDWNQGPFITNYRRFGIDGCVSQNTSLNQECLSPNLSRNLQKELSPREKMMYRRFRKQHLVYDYCLDKERQQNHPECLVPPI